ncbi:sulfatase-like hydrolase/transferase [Sphingobacterium sp. UT-1RO-CII-1]|uniref:sulfatase-like hydrolase/transferase n=1 Tax=Sphingobacterium sp. UT-1RO-CII-1 TaxID=2995225 RepID=UPI00227B3F98|nr:sulfatase-like hydrolase/transferase [Sphingobacterium sp. UT-1RO-CII-1]MCY4778653.1 sulfatase-like hydrolase/transferase [Sphingobacterium sp. UT-1RO-CII-1]
MQKIISATIISIFLFISNAEALEKKEKPNILFILTDDQSYNTIRALGNTHIITPHMDELVQGGTTFSHAYNMGAWHGAVCVASRTMLLTGLSVWDAKSKEPKLDSLVKTKDLWSQQLREAGYKTYMTGKWHINADIAQSFDYVGNLRPGMASDSPAGYNRPQSENDVAWLPWDTSNGGYWNGGKHWSEVLADDAIWFIDKAAKERSPFFMYLAFNAPHDPRQAPEEYINLYPIESISIPENFLTDYPYKEDIGCGTNLRDERLAPWPRTQYAVKKHIQEYYALITHLDAQIGKITQALKNSELFENTLIILTSDHGLAVGSHGLMGKQNMYDHSLRVPMVLHGPGIPPGIIKNQQIYIQDIMPTTLELLNINKPKHVFYNSFLDILKNQSQNSHYHEIYGCYMDLQRMVLTDSYKLIFYPKINTTLLFDVQKDPFEKNNLADKPEYNTIVSDMKKRLAKQQQILHDPLLLNSSNSTLK